MDDLISRQAAIDALERLCDNCCPYSKKQRYVMCGACALGSAFDAIADVPSAQQWHVITKRPMTEGERKEWSERLGHDIEYDEAYFYSNLPDDGQPVLVSTRYGVYEDTFHQDDECYFETNGDMYGILAWMPLPEPLKDGELAL